MLWNFLILFTEEVSESAKLPRDKLCHCRESLLCLLSLSWV